MTSRKDQASAKKDLISKRVQQAEMEKLPETVAVMLEESLGKALDPINALLIYPAILKVTYKGKNMSFNSVEEAGKALKESVLADDKDGDSQRDSPASQEDQETESEQ